MGTPGVHRKSLAQRLGKRLDELSAGVIKFRLFACSYAPLFLISGIRFQTPWLSISCYLIAGVSAMAGLSVVRASRSETGSPYVISKVEDRGPDVAGYLATYLLPFVTAAEPTGRDLIGYAIFLAVAAVLYVRSEMILYLCIFGSC